MTIDMQKTKDMFRKNGDSEIIYVTDGDNVSVTLENADSYSDMNMGTEVYDVYRNFVRRSGMSLATFSSVLDSWGIKYSLRSNVDVKVGDLYFFKYGKKGGIVSYDEEGKVILLKDREAYEGWYRVKSVVKKSKTFTLVDGVREVVDLYPNVSYEEALAVLKKRGYLHEERDFTYHQPGGTCSVEKQIVAWNPEYGLIGIGDGITVDGVRKFNSFIWHIGVRSRKWEEWLGFSQGGPNYSKYDSEFSEVGNFLEIMELSQKDCVPPIDEIWYNTYDDDAHSDEDIARGRRIPEEFVKYKKYIGKNFKSWSEKYMQTMNMN